MANKTRESLEALHGCTVYDSTGEKVGKIAHLYIGDASGLPTWVSVKTGFFGTSHSLVPLAGATHAADDRLNVAVTKAKIKDAPHLDDDGGLTEQQERELLQHYGLTAQDAGWARYGRTERRVASTDETAARPPADPTSVVRSEERLNVGTRKEEVGRARLRKYVVTEEQSVTVPVSHDEARVVREPITDASRVTGEIGDATAEVTLHEDRVVVDKETVPVERVGLQVDEVAGEKTVRDNVRKERVAADGVNHHTDDTSTGPRTTR